MAKLTDFQGRPHSGLVPFAVVGVVTDNVDPDELGRIQVKFPTLHEEPLSFWLRQSSPNGGQERGLYALPEVDDEVLVVFMQGSQDVGVIIGQFWNGVDIPPQECKDGLPGSGATDTGGSLSTDKFSDGSTDLSNNDRRFWKSRSGHLFVFDDTPGAESVQMWDNTHTLAFVFETAEQRILLTNSAGDIHIRCAQDFYFEAGRDILFKAGQHIKGESVQNTELTAGMDFAIDAGMNLDATAGVNARVEATAALKLSGLTAELAGSAQTTITGGVVMIN